MLVDLEFTDQGSGLYSNSQMTQLGLRLTEL